MKSQKENIILSPSDVNGCKNSENNKYCIPYLLTKLPATNKINIFNFANYSNITKSQKLTING